MIKCVYGRSPIVKMRFSFGRELKNIEALGVLDTGATTTQVPLGVLLKYGVAKNVIDEEIDRLQLLFPNDMLPARSSSGVSVQTIGTQITDVIIRSDCKSVQEPNLNIRLALTSNSDIVLLGYDFIIAHKSISNQQNRLCLDDFNRNYYESISVIGTSVDINDIMSFISI